MITIKANNPTANLLHEAAEMERAASAMLAALQEASGYVSWAAAYNNSCGNHAYEVFDKVRAAIKQAKAAGIK